MNKYDDPFKNIWEIEFHYDNGEWYEDNDSYDYVEYVYGTTDDVRQYIKNKIEYGIGEYKECTDRYVKCGESQMGYFRTYDDGKQYSINSWSFYSETVEDDYCILNGKCAEHDGFMNSYAWATREYKAHITTLDNIITIL